MLAKGSSHPFCRITLLSPWLTQIPGIPHFQNFTWEPPMCQGVCSHQIAPRQARQRNSELTPNVWLDSAYPFILALILPFYICFEDGSRMDLLTESSNRADMDCRIIEKSAKIHPWSDMKWKISRVLQLTRLTLAIRNEHMKRPVSCSCP